MINIEKRGFFDRTLQRIAQHAIKKAALPWGKTAFFFIFSASIYFAAINPMASYTFANVSCARALAFSAPSLAIWRSNASLLRK